MIHCAIPCYPYRISRTAVPPIYCIKLPRRNTDKPPASRTKSHRIQANRGRTVFQRLDCQYGRIRTILIFQYVSVFTVLVHSRNEGGRSVSELRFKPAVLLDPSLRKSVRSNAELPGQFVTEVSWPAKISSVSS